MVRALSEGIGSSERCFDSCTSVNGTSVNDLDKPFKLVTDASNIGVGGALMPEGEEGADHSLSFYSKKLLVNKHHKWYFTVEKKTLALILVLKYFEVYVTSK